MSLDPSVKLITWSRAGYQYINFALIISGQSCHHIFPIQSKPNLFIKHNLPKCCTKRKSLKFIEIHKGHKTQAQNKHRNIFDDLFSLNASLVLILALVYTKFMKC